MVQTNSYLEKAGHKVIAAASSSFPSRRCRNCKTRYFAYWRTSTLVGHSYGGAVITMLPLYNPNVTGLVYIAAFAPDEGQSLSTFVNPTNFPKELFMPDSGGFIYLNPKIFRENFAQDVDPAEANIMAITQKPFHQSNCRTICSSGMEAIANVVSNFSVSS